MKADRDKISARIRALLAKTTDNGCTEDEAIAAAAKAAEMLERYNLTVDEVQLRESPFKKQTSQHRDAVGERLWKPASAIAKLTGTIYWASLPGVVPSEINFFGFEHEVEIAEYLLAICTRAMRDHAQKLDQQFALFVGPARARKVNPYLDGMADRLRERILNLVPAVPTGTGLIVLRDELIAQAMKDAGIETKGRRARRSRDLEEQYQRGREAADQVSLAQGVSGPRDQSDGKVLK